MSRCLLFKETETAQDRGCGLNNKKVLEIQYAREANGREFSFLRLPEPTLPEGLGSFLLP